MDVPVRGEPADETEPSPAELLDRAADLHEEASRLFHVHGDHVRADQQRALADEARRGAEQARANDRRQ